MDSNDKRLIELVKKHRQLYDLSHEAYSDKTYKDLLWKKIGKELNLNGLACKQRWMNIRDNYRKSFKRNKIRLEKGQSVTPYKFAKQVSFLREYYEKQDAEFKNISAKMMEDECSDEYKDEEDYNMQSSDDENSQQDTKRSRKSNFVTYEVTEDNKEFIMQSTSSDKQKSNTSQRDDVEDSKHFAENPFLDPLHPKMHEVDAFLYSLSPSLKQLSPYQWHIAKSEMFSLVQKFEIERLKSEGQVEKESAVVGNNITVVDVLPIEC